jgi:hypothetical protein
VIVRSSSIGIDAVGITEINILYRLLELLSKTSRIKAIPSLQTVVVKAAYKAAYKAVWRRRGEALRKERSTVEAQCQNGRALGKAIVAVEKKSPTGIHVKSHLIYVDHTMEPAIVVQFSTCPSTSI